MRMPPVRQSALGSHFFRIATNLLTLRELVASLANPLRMITISIVEGGKQGRQKKVLPPTAIPLIASENNIACIRSFFHRLCAKNFGSVKVFLDFPHLLLR